MEFKTLENTALETVHEAFVDAFSDYQVKMDLPFWKFQNMMKRRGFTPELSMGAFSEERLVGFVLNGYRIHGGKRTVYDMGTGVVKDFRRQGITTRILKELEVLLKENHVEQYLLEVLQVNTSAFELYQKQGFQITRGLNCYKLSKDLASLEKKHEVIRIKTEQWEFETSFWDYMPSWQNSTDSIHALEEAFSYAQVFEGEELVGYGVIDTLTGDIPQLAVKKTHRRKGIGSSILKDLLEQTEAKQGVFLNVEDTMESVIAFLMKSGAENTVDQYEMIKGL